MKACNYLQKTSDLPMSTEIIKQTHKIIMDGEKDVLAGEYRKWPAFAGYHTFAPAGHIERYMEDALLDFIKLNKMAKLWLLQIYLEKLWISIL